MRKLKAGIWMLMLALALASCGGGASDPTTADGDTPATTQDGTDTTGSGSELPTREEILERAEQESGEVVVGGSFTDEQLESLAAAFTEAHPFATASFLDVSSSESPTVLLELAAGTHRTDVIKIEEGTAMAEYQPLMEQVDLPGLVESGALEHLATEMIDPSGHLMSYATYLGVTSWNTDRIAEFDVNMEEVETWDDFLDMCEALPDGAVISDVNAELHAPLAMVEGEEWLAEHATAFIERCRPTFVRGGSVRITGLASGEYVVNTVGNNHHALRAIADGAPIETKFLSPVTGKGSGLTGIRAGTERYYQSLLMLDFLASPAAQQIFDEQTPAGSFQPNGDPFEPNAGHVNYAAVQDRETAITDWNVADDYPRWIDIMFEAWGYPTGE